MFSKDEEVVLEDVKDLGEFPHPFLGYDRDEGAWELISHCEGGYARTSIDFASLVKWIDENREEIDLHLNE